MREASPTNGTRRHAQSLGYLDRLGPIDMKALEDILTALLEFFGFEVAQFALGDLFPGALIGFLLAAAAGGTVSDWQYRQQSEQVKKLPLDWAASIAAFLLSILMWYLLFVA